MWRYIILLLASITVSISTDPSYCTGYHVEYTQCNCHNCNCHTCYTCGCHVSVGSCSYDSCGNSGCWCSPVCRCCRDSNCGYACQCQTCCDTCSTMVCSNTIYYHVNSIDPAVVDSRGGSTISVLGGTFFNSGQIKCRFDGNIDVTGQYISDSKINCPVPSHVAGTVTVEVSLDGTHWTTSGKTIRYYTCPPGLPAPYCHSNGTCMTDNTCSCFDGFWGSFCQNQCPGGSRHPCSDHSLLGDCNNDGTCTCQTGYWGTACENTCPGGVANICSGHGTCLGDGTCLCNTGYDGPMCQYACDPHAQCQCPAGRWGPACSQICPGGETTPCSLHGDCSVNGTCFCRNGYYGDTCQNHCQPSASNPCNGHSLRGTCSADGTCECQHGWYGDLCDQQCPGGSTNACSGHGWCTPGGSCDCDWGWVGDDCSIECAGGHVHPCTDQGICLPGGTCLCDTGYFNPTCSGVCPGTQQGLPCSGNGDCNDQGACVCKPGYFGVDCDSICPGGVPHPCNDHGYCNRTGSCICSPGYAGSACQLTCPTSPGGSPCNNNGVCQPDGTCKCNPSFNGTNCVGRYCPYNCYNHAKECKDGTCICTPEWTDTYCSTPTGKPDGASHGFISFALNKLDVAEEAQTLRIIIKRTGGWHGPVVSTVSTQDDSALAGSDYIGLSDVVVAWNDGEATDKYVDLVIVQDTIPEDTETFKVVLTSVSGGAELGTPKEMVIAILANDQDLVPPGEVIQITLRLKLPFTNFLPEGSKWRLNYEAGFVSDVADNTEVPTDRFIVLNLKPDDKQPLISTLFTFRVVSSTDRAQPTPSQLTLKFLGAMKNPDDDLYRANYTQYIDITFMPLVLTTTAPSPAPDQPTNVIPWAVGGSILGLIAIGCVVGWVKRRPLTDWLLWKLGNFRFTRFQDTSDKTSSDGVVMTSGADGPGVDMPLGDMAAPSEVRDTDDDQAKLMPQTL